MAQTQAIRNVLQGAKTGEIFYDEPMSLHASLKLGGKADALVVIENEDQLGDVIRRLKHHGIPFLPVGNLTNILVRDGGYRGALLWMRGLDQISLEPAGGGGCRIHAQAGVALGKMVNLAAAEALTGMEFCAGIPGSVGGAVWMNAGAYGKEMKDIVEEATVVDGGGDQKILKRADIAFSYRRSNLPADAVICSARFVLEKGDGARIRARMEEIMNLRREKHPLQYPNAGSVFKNPPGMPAGKLIEELGLKGMRRGDVQISKMHANFIVNKGRGTAADMELLMAFVQEQVRKERGVELETEIAVIGEK